MKEKHIQNEELVFNMIQGQIGYDFKNLDLLKQAFVRRSYTEENGGEDNEVLEFIGDKVLDVIVVKLLNRIPTAFFKCFQSVLYILQLCILPSNV